VLVASAGDLLANAHLRLAWEANAALPEEVTACHFDPALPEPKAWSSARDLRNGLRWARRRPLGVFDSFQLNEPFRRFYASPAVRDARRLRDEAVHRARPSYREAPAFGRTTLWTEGRISVKYPPPPDRLQALPTLNDWRKLIAAAIDWTLDYGAACWDLAVRWLRTIDVWVIPEGLDTAPDPDHLLRE